ncbi:Fc.00g019300.m01.CDS01 [Cosmosporella sp. VM-42]
MMKWALLLVAAATTTVLGAPIGPEGPCPDAKVDAILKGEMDPSECCSYGRCKGDVVISVGD